MRKYFFVIAIVVLVLDRLAKWAIASNIALHESVVVIPGFFQLTYVQNTGAAFGLFDHSSAQWKVGALVSFSVVALIVVSALLWKNSHSLSTTTIGLSLILGGAMGNLWDRMMSGRVVDFLDFYVGSYHWPAFNVADTAIVIGAILLISEIFFAKPASETVKTSS
jgi:signal peptidase II